MSISVQNLSYLIDQIILLEIDHTDLIKEHLNKIVQHSLIYDLHNRWNSEIISDDCIEISLTLLNVYRRLEIEPFQSLLDLFINLDSNSSKTAIGLFLEKDYSPDEVFALVDWLVSLIGKQVWEWTSSFYPSKLLQDAPFCGSVTLLDCIIQQITFSDRLSSQIDDISRFQILSIDYLIDKLKGVKNVQWLEFMQQRFRQIIPTQTKLGLIEYQFQSRKTENEKQIMFDQIYSGSSYRRDAIEQKHSCNLILERESILQDSLNAFNRIPKSIAIDNINVSYVAEDGQDRGGLTKEWCLLMMNALERNVLIRVEDEAEYMDLNPHCTEEQAYLFGIVLGVAILRKIVLDVSLAPFVFELLVNSECSMESKLDMLKCIRPGFTKGLRQLQSWVEEDQGIIEDSFSLDFTFIDENAKVINLVPNGEQRRVSSENRLDYIESICDYLLIKRTRNTITSIREGFERICYGIPGLKLFTWNEWDSLIRGEEIANNAATLRQTCQIQMNGKSAKEREEIQIYLALFWSIISQLSKKDFRALLHFITATHRIPSLRSSKQQEENSQSCIVIKILDPVSSENTFPLPTASTCSNTLFLPHYPSFEVLERCLLLAIREGNQGFGLS